MAQANSDSAATGGLLVIAGVVLAVVVILFLTGGFGMFGSKSVDVNVDMPKVSDAAK